MTSVADQTTERANLMEISDDGCQHCGEPVGKRAYYELPADDFDGYRPMVLARHWRAYVALVREETCLDDVAAALGATRVGGRR